MLNVSDLQLESRECVVELGLDMELKVTYDPNLITSNTLLDLTKDSDELCQIVSEILISWDLTDNEKKPYPITHDNLANMPLKFVNKIFEAIITDAFPKAESTTSEDSTKEKARRVTRKGRQ